MESGGNRQANSCKRDTQSGKEGLASPFRCVEKEGRRWERDEYFFMSYISFDMISNLAWLLNLFQICNEVLVNKKIIL